MLQDVPIGYISESCSNIIAATVQKTHVGDDYKNSARMTAYEEHTTYVPTRT
jgi:hypothetical protein